MTLPSRMLYVPTMDVGSFSFRLGRVVMFKFRWGLSSPSCVHGHYHLEKLLGIGQHEDGGG